MRVGVLTGTGTYTLPGAGEGSLEKVITVHGDVPVTRLELGGVEILHISRHGEGHTRLSNHVAHRANILALQQLGPHRGLSMWSEEEIRSTASLPIACAAVSTLPTKCGWSMTISL